MGPSRNPEDRFSHKEAHIIMSTVLIDVCCTSSTNLLRVLLDVCFCLFSVIQMGTFHGLVAKTTTERVHLLDLRDKYIRQSRSRSLLQWL